MLYKVLKGCKRYPGTTLVMATIQTNRKGNPTLEPPLISPLLLNSACKIKRKKNANATTKK